MPEGAALRDTGRRPHPVVTGSNACSLLPEAVSASDDI